MSQLYTSQPTVNRLLTTFSSLFPSATRRTRHLLAWLLIAQLALESAPSVRCLFRQFLSKQTDASLNSYYRALGNGLVTDASIRQALALQALAIVPEALRQEPILLSVDDTSIAKWGKHFDGVGILYDHAKHDGKSYFNGEENANIRCKILTDTKSNYAVGYCYINNGYDGTGYEKGHHVLSTFIFVIKTDGSKIVGKTFDGIKTGSIRYDTENNSKAKVYGDNEKYTYSPVNGTEETLDYQWNNVKSPSYNNMSDK